MNLSGRRSAPGRWIIATKRNIMIPKSRPDQRTPVLVAMLSDAAINAQPTKYTQKERQGMYAGTMSSTNSGPERWSAPKTARGTAKHRLPRATTLSSPRASAISFLATHAPIRKTAMPAEHIATAVGGGMGSHDAVATPRRPGPVRDAPVEPGPGCAGRVYRVRVFL